MSTVTLGPTVELLPFPMVIPLVEVETPPKVKADCFPLKVDQSPEVKYPLTRLVAAGIEMVLTNLDKGAEKVSALSFPLKVPQSVKVRQPV